MRFRGWQNIAARYSNASRCCELASRLDTRWCYFTSHRRASLLNGCRFFVVASKKLTLDVDFAILIWTDNCDVFCFETENSMSRSKYTMRVFLRFFHETDKCFATMLCCTSNLITSFLRRTQQTRNVTCSAVCVKVLTRLRTGILAWYAAMFRYCIASVCTHLNTSDCIGLLRCIVIYVVRRLLHMILYVDYNVICPQFKYLLVQPQNAIFDRIFLKLRYVVLIKNIDVFVS